jgi:hypothetical protein
MIRLKSAFLITLLGCVAAYFLGFMNGYLIAGDTLSTSSSRKWIEDSTAAYYDPLDKRSREVVPFITRPQSGDRFGFRGILTPDSGDAGLNRKGN